MRLDKFLKVSRIIKRRTVAASAAGMGRVFVNGNEAKPGKQLKLNDEIEIFFGDSSLKVIVKSLKETVRKDDADTMYEVINE